MNISLEEKGTVVIIRVKDGCWFDGNRGNYETQQQVKQCMQKSFDEGKNNIIIDLRNLQSISDDWISVLVTAYKLTMAHHGDLKFADPSPSVKELLRLTRLDRIFQVYDSIDEAIGKKSVRTHYDNLKVPRDASKEVILSAYRALVSQYESEWIRGEPEAERIKSIIDEAVEVLADPEKRKEHDEWIVREEMTEPLKPVPEEIEKEAEEAASLPPNADKEQLITEDLMTRARKYLRPLLIAFGVVAGVLCLLWGGRYKPLGSTDKFVYVSDRLTGNIIAIIGIYKVTVTEK